MEEAKVSKINDLKPQLDKAMEKGLRRFQSKRAQLRKNKKRSKRSSQGRN